MKSLMVTFFGLLMLVGLAGWYPGGTLVHPQVCPHESRQEACINATQLTRQVAAEREAGLVMRDAAVEQIVQIGSAARACTTCSRVDSFGPVIHGTGRMRARPSARIRAATPSALHSSPASINRRFPR
jgi:hypothetical protein